MPHKSATIDGVLLNYRDVGNGLPVVLLHGWGSDISSFSRLERDLSAGFRVISLDLPGFGNSASPPGVWSLIDYCHLVEHFLKFLNLVHPVLIGHSFGGRISIVLGAKGIAGKLILVNSAGVPSKKSLIYYCKVYFYKSAKFCLKILPAQLQARLLERLQQKFGSSDYRNAAPLLRQILVKVVNEDLSPLLPQIKVPTLLMWGDSDQTTPLYQAKIMEKRIPDSGLVVLKNAGHYCYLDKPQEFYTIVNHFLSH